MGLSVIFDATHSVQLPGGAGYAFLGATWFVPYLAKAAAAARADGFFMEVHDNPEEALSDGRNMLYLRDLEDLLRLKAIVHCGVKGEGENERFDDHAKRIANGSGRHFRPWRNVWMQVIEQAVAMIHAAPGRAI